MAGSRTVGIGLHLGNAGGHAYWFDATPLYEPSPGLVSVRGFSPAVVVDGLFHSADAGFGGAAWDHSSFVMPTIHGALITARVLTSDTFYDITTSAGRAAVAAGALAALGQDDIRELVPTLGRYRYLVFSFDTSGGTVLSSVQESGFTELVRVRAVMGGRLEVEVGSKVPLAESSITVIAGDSLDLEFRFRTENTGLFDLTGATVSFALHRSPWVASRHSTLLLGPLDLEIDENPVVGLARLHVDGADLAVLAPGGYVGEILLTAGDTIQRSQFPVQIARAIRHAGIS